MLSFGALAHWRPTPFDLLDHVTSNVMLPIGGFGLAIVPGWVLPGAFLSRELRLGARGGAVLRWVLRWATPTLIALTGLAPIFL